jgi:hypothetical protein
VEKYAGERYCLLRKYRKNPVAAYNRNGAEAAPSIINFYGIDQSASAGFGSTDGMSVGDFAAGLFTAGFFVGVVVVVVGFLTVLLVVVVDFTVVEVAGFLTVVVEVIFGVAVVDLTVVVVVTALGATAGSAAFVVLISAPLRDTRSLVRIRFLTTIPEFLIVGRLLRRVPLKVISSAF